MPDLTPIEQYAINLIIDGASSTAEDDLNEDGELSEEDHEKAVDLALDLVQEMRLRPNYLLNLQLGKGI